MPRRMKKLPPPEPVQENPPAITREVQSISLAAGGLLLFVAVFFPYHTGFLGRVASNFLHGVFGVGAIIMPIALIMLAIGGMVKREIRIPYIKITAIYWFVLALLHIIFQYGFDDLTAPARYRNIFDRDMAHILGGGVVGAVLGDIAQFILFTPGAIIALTAGIIILSVLISGRSFVGFLGRGAKKAKTIYDEKRTRAKELKEETEVLHEPVQVHEVSEPIRKAKVIKEIKRVPVAKVKDGTYGGKSQLFEIEGLEELKPTTKVLLIHEEIEEQKKLQKMNDPLFLQRDKRLAPIPFDDVIEFTIPDEDEYFEDEYMYEDEYDEEPEPVKPPVDLEGYGKGLIVKGLVVDEPDVPFEMEETEAEDIELDKVTGALVSELQEAVHEEPDYSRYELPGIHFLAVNHTFGENAKTRQQVIENSKILEDTLRSFKIDAKVIEVSVGPAVTRYDLAPGPGVKVSSIVNLSNDLALSLAAQGIRIEAPIPGKSAVGIEIPNKEAQPVFLREIIEDAVFQNFTSKLAFGVGKDIAGEPVVADIARMPHLLIAGATGSGKSVCINTLITSILYKSRPDEVKLLMIDPKVVELSVYNGIPHLLIPVVTDPKKASGALSWAVQEMETRYNLFAGVGSRDLKGYNAYMVMEDEPELPQIVIIIDELADLMMVAKSEVEESICRLAQKARAAGIHLIVATQRPSVDVITGLIKANIPSRLAFAVSSGIDSRTVIDMYGAEKLLGRGDMLFLPMGQNKPIRVQGAFISDKEVEKVVSFLKTQAPAVHTTEMIQQVTMPGKSLVDGEVDEFFHDAIDFLLTKGKASTSMLQRQFRIGYNRASRLMEDLEIRGIVGPEDGVKPRKVTITRSEYKELYG